MKTIILLSCAAMVPLAGCVSKAQYRAEGERAARLKDRLEICQKATSEAARELEVERIARKRLVRKLEAAESREQNRVAMLSKTFLADVRSLKDKLQEASGRSADLQRRLKSSQDSLAAAKARFAAHAQEAARTQDRLAAQVEAGDQAVLTLKKELAAAQYELRAAKASERSLDTLLKESKAKWQEEKRVLLETSRRNVGQLTERLARMDTTLRGFESRKLTTRAIFRKQEGKISEAEEDFRRALQRDGANVKARRGLARLLAEGNQTAEAVAQWKKFARVFRDRPSLVEEAQREIARLAPEVPAKTEEAGNGLEEMGEDAPEEQPEPEAPEPKDAPLEEPPGNAEGAQGE